MVIGGHPNYDEVELVSLDEDVTIPDCLLTIRPLPDEGRWFAAGAAVLPGNGKFTTKRRLMINIM